MHDFRKPQDEPRGTDFVRQITIDGRGNESTQRYQKQNKLIFEGGKTNRREIIGTMIAVSTVKL